MSVRILVLYHSSYGHVETMAHSVAAGAREAPGAQVFVKRVPELVPEDIARRSGMHIDQDAPVAQSAELADYDAIIFGTPTRYGMMSAQMRNFLDQTGSLWARGALVGKIGSVFASTGSQHAGQESTLLSFHVTLLHFGMLVVGLPTTAPQLATMRAISGGTPYGATTIAGPDGSRSPSANELELAHIQGRHVASLACRLSARESCHGNRASVV